MTDNISRPRSNLSVLRVIKNFYENNPETKTSGMCGVLLRLVGWSEITCVEERKIYGYLKNKFNPKGVKVFWWKMYDTKVRYEAICKCIKELEDLNEAAK